MGHACPACTHKQPNEPCLLITMYVTVDGNDSLKRFERRETAPETVEHDFAEMGESVERTDSRDGRGDYILHPDVVNTFSQGTETTLSTVREPCWGKR